VILETERLVLRPFRLEDVDDLVAMTAGPAHRPEFLLFSQTKETAKRMVWASVYNGQNKYFETRRFGIQVAGSMRLIGHIILFISRHDPIGNLGYELHPDFWNRGFMTEAIRRVLAFGFEDCGVEKISAGADLENVGSWRAMEKAGMVREGLLRHARRYEGVRRDTVLYGALRD
jgi:ribosomal-protein-alanine N-acetyltransferase